MPRVGPVVVALVVLGAARVASPSAGSWLAWSSSSDGCGDAGAFAARVERALGRSPALAASEAHVNVTARIAITLVGGAPRWVGEVQLRGDDQRELGSRTIDRRDASCQPLVEAMAVVTALALADDGLVTPPLAEATDPPGPNQLTGATPEPPVAGTPSPPRVIPEAPPVTAAPARERPVAAPPRAEPVASLSSAPPLATSSRRWRSGAEAAVKVGAGLLPSVALGAEVAAYLRTAGGLKVFLAFSGWQRQSALDALGRGASFQRLDGSLGVCPLALTRGAWDGTACLAGDVGRLSISGVGFDTASTQDRLVLDAGVGLALSRRVLGPLAAGLGLGVTAPLIRDRISYGTTAGGVVSIYRESLVAAVGSFRLGLVF